MLVTLHQFEMGQVVAHHTNLLTLSFQNNMHVPIRFYPVYEAACCRENKTQNKKIRASYHCSDGVAQEELCMRVAMLLSQIIVVVDLLVLHLHAGQRYSFANKNSNETYHEK